MKTNIDNVYMIFNYINFMKIFFMQLQDINMKFHFIFATYNFKIILN